MKKISEFLQEYLKKTLINLSLLIVLSIIVLSVGVSLYIKKKQIVERSQSLSRVLSGLAFDHNLDLISRVGRLHSKFDSFNSLVVQLKTDGRTIYQIHGDRNFLPVICSTEDSSDVLRIVFCEEIISASQFLNLLIMTLVILSFFYVFLILSKSHLDKVFNDLNDEMSNLFEEKKGDINTIFTNSFEVLKMKSLIKKNNELILKESMDQAVLELSRRVVHDLKSPSTLIRRELINLTGSKDHINAALDSIDLICNNLLNETRQNLQIIKRSNNERIMLYDFFIDIINKKHIETNEKFITLINFNSDIGVWLNRNNLSRCISNLLNNSYESILSLSKKKVVIRYSFNSSSLEIEIHDNGQGFSNNFFNSFDKKVSFSDKQDGNGIGVLSTHSYMESIGGELICKNDNGATVRLSFPFSLLIKRNDFIVLIEDDKYVAYEWISKAKSKNIPIKWYRRWAELMPELNNYSPNTEFYVDSSLEDSICGEEIAVLLYKDNFKRINICSNFPPDKFNNYSFLNSVTSKTFPY